MIFSWEFLYSYRHHKSIRVYHHYLIIENGFCETHILLITNNTPMNKKLLTTLAVVPVVALGAGLAFASEDNALGDIYDERIDQVISMLDWNTLSDEAIDEKLVQAQLEPIGDPRDPLYSLSMEEIDNLSDEEWEKIDEAYNELYGDDWFEFDFDELKEELVEESQEVLKAVQGTVEADTYKAIENIARSLEAIDEEEALFDALDNMYELAPEAVEAYFEAEYGDEWDDYDLYEEMDLLRDKDQIVEAEREWYEEIKSELDVDTQKTMESLIRDLEQSQEQDAFMDALDALYEFDFGEEWDEDYAIDFETERQEIIDEVQDIFDEIASELDTDTRNTISNIIDSLDSLNDEDAFFSALDEAYELASDEIDAYFEAEYGDL